MWGIVVVAVLHQCLINDISTGHQVTTATAAGYNKAQFFGIDSLFFHEILNGLLTKVHLIEDVLHTGNHFAVYIQIALTDVHRILIIGNLCRSRARIQYQNLIHIRFPRYFPKCSMP